MPLEFFNGADLHVRRSSRQSGFFSIQTKESYYRNRPALVASQNIAGPRQQSSTFPTLSQISTRAGESSSLDQFTQKQIHNIEQRILKSNSIVDVFYLWILQTMVAGPQDLAGTAEGVYRGLHIMALEGDSNEHLLENSAVHVVTRSEALVRRVKFPAVLLRIAHDDQLRAGDFTYIKNSLAKGDRPFSSGDGLLHGIYTFDAYLAPLIGCMTPQIWAFSAHRTFGAVVYSFGRHLAGLNPGAAELLHLVPRTTETSRTWTSPTLSPAACSDAIAWWTKQLNEIFSVLSDPVVFADKTNTYDPVRHHQKLLTAEQLFRRTGSILTSYRDAEAQQVLLFTVLDILDRISQQSVEKSAHLVTAERALTRLRGTMSPTAAEVLLPLAERAVAALKSVQDGFFIRSSSTKPDEMKIFGLSKVNAAAKYVKLLRDATHGHGAKNAGRVAETNALLANHDGTISHDLPLLGYLYLLDFMSRPQDLRRRLMASTS
ncbi:hypothetical protein Drose_36765 [Dactylosporangium roseum]|uniref:Apea-like HEPN domain-containing protein n=1 Tax=Dactylosporangium roseum TaxID=47989 RepID=A0ABY5Z6P8_9ACTN|nr:hypothetical protein [Dactylosporangium roseum]UWZ36507.1 hypothetical protein Drose_36765 [Dactylosporangium roseum]